MDQLLKVNEAASRLRLRPATLWKMLGQRQLASVKIGRSRRVLASEIERIIREGTSPAEECRRG